MLASAELRRNWALWIITGGGMAMSVYAAVALFLIKEDSYIFYLALAAMVNIFVLFGGIASLLVKRTLSITKSGVSMQDHVRDQ